MVGLGSVSNLTGAQTVADAAFLRVRPARASGVFEDDVTTRAKNDVILIILHPTSKETEDATMRMRQPAGVTKDI